MIASAATDVVEPFHEFFLAGAGVAGALIGLLFVAVSVAPHRVTGDTADPAQRIRAASALSAFTNALTVSLFALIPTMGLGVPALIVGVLGLTFVAASLVSVRRERALHRVGFRDVGFLVGLVAVFVIEIVTGIRLADHAQTGAVTTIAILVAICFLIGIGRAWELIGARSFGLASELAAAIRDADAGRAAPHGGGPTAPADRQG